MQLALSRPMGPRPQQTDTPVAAAAAPAARDGGAGDGSGKGKKGGKKRLKRSEAVVLSGRPLKAVRPEAAGAGRGAWWGATGMVRGPGSGGGAPAAGHQMGPAVHLRAQAEGGAGAAVNSVAGRTPEGAAAAPEVGLADVVAAPSSVRQVVPALRTGRPPLVSPVPMPALAAGAGRQAGGGAPGERR